MASSNSRSSSVSCTDSGISCSSTFSTVNPQYACYWTPNCNGYHEFDDCPIRSRQLRGKLGIYYSPNAVFKRFMRDQINGLQLESNPTGCTMVNLLIYKIENDETWLLFATKLLRQQQQKNAVKPSQQLLLALPSSHPSKKDELQKDTAARVLEYITNETEVTKNIRSRLKRFFFVDASVIYPLLLNTEEVNRLKTDFSTNEEIRSLHWFPLSMVLSRMPQWDDYLRMEATEKELAQIRHNFPEQMKLNTDNQEYTMWSPTQCYLMCIRNHVGFDTFLQI
ncbi:unnamed protein product [Rotaria magnacalcarata]|uniref:Uncharacterized protein n=1 Tax=Rotaria magnacalcarata TaxID=392030 RepID=A0A816L0Z1_9BILA|nr:unnamed protein product [Rotaria magnacalcarata]CAF3859010.1 unnamed protein product [Rotaria magnacalcarata]